MYITHLCVLVVWSSYSGQPGKICWMNHWTNILRYFLCICCCWMILGFGVFLNMEEHLSDLDCDDILPLNFLNGYWNLNELTFRWTDHSPHPITGSFCPCSDCCSLCITFIRLLSPFSNEYQWFTAKGWLLFLSLRRHWRDMVGSETTLLKQSFNCFS